MAVARVGIEAMRKLALLGSPRLMGKTRLRVVLLFLLVALVVAVAICSRVLLILLLLMVGYATVHLIIRVSSRIHTTITRMEILIRLLILGGSYSLRVQIIPCLLVVIVVLGLSLTLFVA